MATLIIIAALIIAYLVTGRYVTAKSTRSLEKREQRLAHILVIPSEEVAYTLPVQKSMFVSTGLSLSADLLRMLFARVFMLFGGRLRSLEQVSNQARRELLVRLKEQCADALCITGVRFEMMRQRMGKVEALAYGTALYAPDLSPAAYRMLPKASTAASHFTPPPLPRRQHAQRPKWNMLAASSGMLIAVAVWSGVALLYYRPSVKEQVQPAPVAQETPAPAAAEPVKQEVATSPPVAASALPAFDELNYEQLSSVSKKLQREYDVNYRYFQTIYAKGALDKPEFLQAQLVKLGQTEALRVQHYSYAVEILKRTRKNIDDMASAMKASPQLASTHTDRIDQLIELTRQLGDAEQDQLLRHRDILQFLASHQGSYTLSGKNVIRFDSEGLNENFNALNHSLLEAETARNTVAEKINSLADAQP